MSEFHGGLTSRAKDNSRPPLIRQVVGYKPLGFAMMVLRRIGVSLPELGTSVFENSTVITAEAWREWATVLARREFELFSHHRHRALRLQAGRETKEMRPLLDWSERIVERKAADPVSVFPDFSMSPMIRTWWEEFDVSVSDGFNDQVVAPLLGSEEQDALAAKVAPFAPGPWLTVHWLPSDERAIIAAPPYALLVVGASQAHRPDVESLSAAWRRQRPGIPYE